MAKTPPEQSESAATSDVKGVTKAAILLVTMSGEVAAEVLRHLEDDTIEEITREIAQLDLVGPQDRGKVVEEFYNIALARSYAKQGGMSYAKMLLQKALPAGQAAEVMKVWMESPAHRDVILHPTWNDVGIAVRNGGEHSIYWVQEFGDPAGF